MSKIDNKLGDKRCRPYPEVEIDRQSLSDVRCLAEIYAGAESETTAIMQYIYQSYILREVNDELAELIMRIARSEMHHHEQLGETIAKLGGTPVMGGNRQFWNGAMVNYTKDVLAILNADIRGEEMAIEMYRRAVRCVDNYSIRELLECIIREEEEHLAALREAKSGIIMKN